MKLNRFNEFLEDMNPEAAREMGRVDLRIKDIKAFLSEELERQKVACPICDELTTKKGVIKHIDKMIKIALANQKKEMIERIKKMKKEIRYEELDTGIGIDKLEYDGQEEEHAFNRILDDIIKAIK